MLVDRVPPEVEIVLLLWLFEDERRGREAASDDEVDVDGGDCRVVVVVVTLAVVTGNIALFCYSNCTGIKRVSNENKMERTKGKVEETRVEQKGKQSKSRFSMLIITCTIHDRWMHMDVPCFQILLSPSSDVLTQFISSIFGRNSLTSVNWTGTVIVIVVVE